jgi:hypothetical protein
MVSSFRHILNLPYRRSDGQVNKLHLLYNYFCGKNFAYLLILGLVIKAIISDISIATFLLSIPILSFEAYKIYIKSKKPDPIVINQEVMAELDKLKAKVNAGQFQKGLDAASPSKRYF